ncbi:metallophosphoesterase [Leptospira levettii]|uniref:metallophosphoesterase n=1 Tax=Leptospira levettii TaxID=2023178 RepID=UPI00223D9F35|nr:metallophosphoesterase [Leptospira levettii]MCW7498426.1 metallophosphoesterase [Leptospira levettii]
MRILAIGDIHGRNIWKKINFDDYDKVIFLGDYLDSHRLSNQEILFNLEELVNLQNKRSNVAFLIGNHDLQYTDEDFAFLVSGFRESYQKEASELLSLLKWKFAVEFDGVLYTHAGLLNEFFKSITVIHNNISDTINQVGFSEPGVFLITIHSMRGGDSDAGSSIWCDFRELVMEKDPIPINQVFGHSAREGGKIDRKDRFWRVCIDVLTKYNHAYEILDGQEPIIVNL